MDQTQFNVIVAMGIFTTMLVSVVTLIITIWRFKRVELGQTKLRDLQIEQADQQLKLSKNVADYDIAIKHLQAQESSARFEHTLNVTVEIDVVECESASGKIWILQTNVDVVNGGGNTVCIPAVYVHARTLISSRASDVSEAKFYTSRFADLPPCGGLSSPRNVARLENSIIQVAPGEIEHFVRWDRLNEAFVAEFPAIVVNVEVFGAPYELLGHWSTPVHGHGPLRAKWLNYMKDAQHEVIIFSRATETKPLQNLEMGDRVLLEPTTGQIDATNTKEFRAVLNGVFQWSRQRTVVLRGYLRKTVDEAAAVPPLSSVRSPAAQVSNNAASVQ